MFRIGIDIRSKLNSQLHESCNFLELSRKGKRGTQYLYVADLKGDELIPKLSVNLLKREQLVGEI